MYGKKIIPLNQTKYLFVELEGSEWIWKIEVNHFKENNNAI